MINLKSISLLLSFFLLLLSSCSQKEDPLFLSSGTTSALLNGVTWEAANYATHSSGIDSYHVVTTVRTPEGFSVRELSMGFIPAESDSIFVSYPRINDTSPNVLFVSLDIDAICEFFYLSDNHTNLLLIDSLNENTGYISGRFDFVFIKDTSPACVSSLPDTLRMENGRFESVVIDF